jgi:hypothetical protein
MLANRSFDFTSDKKSVPAELEPSSCILCVTASPGSIFFYMKELTVTDPGGPFVTGASGDSVKNCPREAGKPQPNDRVVLSHGSYPWPGRTPSASAPFILSFQERLW